MAATLHILWHINIQLQELYEIIYWVCGKMLKAAWKTIINYPGLSGVHCTPGTGPISNPLNPSPRTFCIKIVGNSLKANTFILKHGIKCYMDKKKR